MGVLNKPHLTAFVILAGCLVFPPESASASASAATRQAFRTSHGANAATKILLCVAMFRPEKNQRELIEIVAREGSQEQSFGLDLHRTLGAQASIKSQISDLIFEIF